tara:strand:- start:556 stop:1047 length:492 start_codon:yes stop_codon:yes gene_type:complete
MKLEIGTNFKFSKLARRANKLTSKYVDRTKRHIVNTAKRIIDSKKLKPLSEKTIDNRKRGRGWGGVKVAPTSDDTPLKHTGKLYNSLKVTEEGIEGVGYALRHQLGQGVPERKFFPVTITGKRGLLERLFTSSPEVKQSSEVIKFQKKLTQRLIKDMNKAMKK